MFAGFGLLAVLCIAAASSAAHANEAGTPVPILQGEPQDLHPAIHKIRPTPRGYVIIGEGFGRNPDGVSIYENGAPVAEEAIVGVSKSRISVFSIPSGRTGVTVDVRGQRTDAAYFTHVEPPAQDEEPVTTASVKTMNFGTSPRNAVSTDGSKAAGSKKVDGYLAREMLRLRDRVSSLEEEISMLRQQLGVTSR